MNNRERVIASLLHQQPDWIPYHVEFTQKASAKMAAFFGAPDFAGRLGLRNCLTYLETEPENSWKEAAPDIWEDQFGVQWNRTIDKDIGNVCNRLVTPETLHEYPFPDPDDPSRYQSYAGTLMNKQDRFVLANLGFSLFERAWTLAGMQELLIAMVDNKRFAHELFDRILSFNLRIIEHACSFDIDAMRFGDDWGMQNGVIMGPNLWREYIRPRIKQMYELVKSRGKYVFIHSCGKVDELFPDLIDCGVDVFNPFQPEVMDVFAIKRKYGSHLSFFGGISTQRTLPNAGVAQVKEQVRTLLQVIGKQGGYIAAPAHEIPGDAKPENIVAMCEILANQR
jgi:uroporphyrinogen decarboxylase